MRVLVTGSAGFLGWHTQLRMHALTEHSVVPVTRQNWSDLRKLLMGADAVIHIAGVNRGEDSDVEQGNVRLAEELAEAIEGNPSIRRLVFANSIQDGNGSAYGRGKGTAARRLAQAAERVGAAFVDVRLPNLFGEHGRPGYNSFVATFVQAVIGETAPEVSDREVSLLHAQEAASWLIDGLSTPASCLEPMGTTVRVQAVYDLLCEFKESYDFGELPDLSTPFRVALFNTYRAALFPAAYPIKLTPHDDARGRFIETVRCRGGQGQTSISFTFPGVTRGDHYHLSKIERFAVIEGEARISLRRMFSDEVVSFEVRGSHPSAIDMPVGWVHNITNTGDRNLLTQFWAHELFRPEAPDTFFERVGP